MAGLSEAQVRKLFKEATKETSKAILRELGELCVITPKELEKLFSKTFDAMEAAFVRIFAENNKLSTPPGCHHHQHTRHGNQGKS